MATAIVLGSTGQDGYYLTKHLRTRGWNVVGVGRRETSDTSGTPDYEYRSCDLRDHDALADLLRDVQPAAIFHLAAVHASASENSYESVFHEMLDVNVKSLHAALEHARDRGRDAPRLLYAASAKCFGSPLPERIDETTPRVNSCLYSITKNAGASLVEHYRARHDIPAGSAFLFNHESTRRPEGFFVPKLARALRQAQIDAKSRNEFFTLDFYCDWGSAEEYMDIAVDMVEHAPGEDFVLASGRTRYAKNLVEDLFQSYGLRAADHIKVSRSVGNGQYYEAQIHKLQRWLGRGPKVSIEEVIRRMVDASD